MDRLSLTKGVWYAAEFISEIFGNDIRSYSPIKVNGISPLGGRKYNLSFYHAIYPEGVREKDYVLETLERSAKYILVRITEKEPVMYVIIYDVTIDWINMHFNKNISRSEDPQDWLTRNA